MDNTNPQPELPVTRVLELRNPDCVEEQRKEQGEAAEAGTALRKGGRLGTESGLGVDWEMVFQTNA